MGKFLTTSTENIFLDDEMADTEYSEGDRPEMPKVMSLSIQAPQER